MSRTNEKQVQQKQELFNKIWKIADELRGKVDGWDFKNYVLGLLFYRYISEDFSAYIEEDEIKHDQNFKYEHLSDSQISKDIIDELIKEKGYFIYPSQLFKNVLKNYNEETFNEDLSNAFKAIESSSYGKPSENNVRGLFNDIDLNSPKLGKTVIDRNKRIKRVLDVINNLALGDIKDSSIDIFGDAYEYLMGMYASQAGRSGGEYFTPQCVSELLVKLAIGNKKTINKIYDPTCGSGSLLLKATKVLNGIEVEEGFFGQEDNLTTYNLCRINMFLHGINYSKFNIAHDDTLLRPQHDSKKPFDIIVSNPPYSIEWEGCSNPTLINDERYRGPGVLAPKSYSDYAFILHMLHYLSSSGRAAIVCFPGIFYRKGAELKIRQYLVDNNYIDCLIQLPPNLFYGTNISVTIMILSKSKKDNSILFIDASNLYEKITNSNILTENNIDSIVSTYNARINVDNLAILVEYSKIIENNYDLTVSTYIKKKEDDETLDIESINNEIVKNINEINRLQKSINSSIYEINEIIKKRKGSEK